MMEEARNLEQLVKAFRQFLLSGEEVISEDGKEYLQIRTPFWDHAGDPISVTVRITNGTVDMDDGGAIAGQLFSLGQHTQDTPGFKLLSSLADAYDLELDFNTGHVRQSSKIDDFVEGMVDFTKVIITMLTASPFVRVSPRRMPALGPRLRKRIRETYQEQKVLDLVEPDHVIQGSIVKDWSVDFRWQTGSNGSATNVFVIAADLDVREPLSKAERISALALDTQSARNKNNLRVVFDTHGSGSEAKTAANFITEHSGILGYEVFDFGDDVARHAFIEKSIHELLGSEGEHWRALLRK